MIRKILFIIILCIAANGFSQEVNRVLISGRVHVPHGEDAEGISVYNISSQKGTITGKDGAFEIKVAPRDRVQIFSIQYQALNFIVDESVVEEKHMNIYLNSSITQLDEVLVRRYDLSSNLQADIQEIHTYYKDTDWDLSYEALEYDYGFIIDEQSAIRGNVAEEALGHSRVHHGLDFIAILGGVYNLIAPKNKNRTSTLVREQQFNSNLQNRFSRDYLVSNFGIPPENAYEFLLYVQEAGHRDELLHSTSELELIQYLEAYSVEFKQFKNLNHTEIPFNREK